MPDGKVHSGDKEVSYKIQVAAEGGKMTNKYITLETLQREMDLKNLTPDIRMDVNKITVPEINRPALQLTG